MVVVIGTASYRPPDANGSDGVGGLAGRIAEAAAVAGSSVQFIGKVGDDAAGDALVLALGRAGVGHAAVLRDPGHPTPILATPAVDESVDSPADDGPSLVAALVDDVGASIEGPIADWMLPDDPTARPRLEPADLELALRYIGEFGVVVVADPLETRAAEVVAAGAGFAGAHLVAIVPASSAVPAELASATVLEAPALDPDGAFARLVGGYAAALDAGASPADAFRSVVSRAGWEAAEA